jgi:cell division protein FtsQ
VSSTTRTFTGGVRDDGPEPVDVPALDDGSPPGPYRNTRRNVVLILAGVLLLAIVTTWVVAFSSVLGVKTVTVRGAHNVSAARIRSVAAIEQGAPLIRLDTAAIVHRVEALPDVASAAASVSYPGTVVITVVERVPVAYVATEGRYELVDKTGRSYRTTPSQPRTLPRLSMPSGTRSLATAQAEATVAAALGPKLLAKINSIQAFDPGAITLLLTDQRVVHWGTAARSADKAQILPTLLRQPGTQIDVSNPDQPFVR